MAAARRFITEELSGYPQSVLDAVHLLVSELSTNAIRHAHSDFTVSVEVGSDQVRVEVGDRGAGVPAVRDPDTSDPTGRGLRLVEAFSDSWGVDTDPEGGKSVWFSVSKPQ